MGRKTPVRDIQTSRKSPSNRKPQMYRKGQLVLEAQQVPLSKLGNIMQARDQTFRVAMWCGGEMELGDIGITVDTVEGSQLAKPGDWIIKGLDGQYIAYSNESFKKKFTPEEVQDGSEVPQGSVS